MRHYDEIEMARGFGDDQVEMRPDGSRVLTCPLSKGWNSRQAGSQTRAVHPGTAVRWEDAIFEVVEATPLFDRGMRYVLVAWDDRHTIRAVDDYDDAAETGRRQEIGKQRACSGKRRLSILLAPVAGHLPGRVQERMEGDFGAPARVMTVASAIPLLVLGVVGLFAWLRAMMGGGGDLLPWLAEHPVLSAWLACESGVRLGVAFLLAEPVGSIAGDDCVGRWRLARGSPAEVAWKGAPADQEQTARDRFHVIEPLVALLSPDEQKTLERRFGFDPLRWGRRSVLLLGLLGGGNGLISYGHWLSGGSTVADALWFLGALVILLEQVRRRRQIEAGRAAGSVLGGLVRPLARPLLSQRE